MYQAYLNIYMFAYDKYAIIHDVTLRENSQKSNQKSFIIWFKEMALAKMFHIFTCLWPGKCNNTIKVSKIPLFRNPKGN